MKNRGSVRKKRTVMLSAALLAVLLTGCGRPAEDPAGERLKIVCTIFPEYDWVKQILGDTAEEAELTLLMKNGTDLHSYQPTIWDMQKIAEADLFIHVGGESDFWVEDALANTENPHRKVLNLMEILEDSVKEEAHMEGMQTERGGDRAEALFHEGLHGEDKESGREELHGEEKGSGHEAHAEGEAEYDEHVWLSLGNAQEVCRAVTEALGDLRTQERTVYEQNCREYCEKLQALDGAYRQAVGQAQEPVLLFGDRFPFRYLADDYGITCYAAFSGCSAETEASFSTITFLAEKAGELRLPAVLAIDGSDGRIAGTIAGNTDTGEQKVLVLDSMQSVSGRQIEAGENYLSVMERNLEILKEALAVRGGA